MQPFNITQIYPNQYLKDLSTQQYYIGTINKKNTTNIIKIIAIYPISWHLKRVRPLKQQTNEVILCKSNEKQTFEKIKQTLGQLLISQKVLQLPQQPCPLKEKFSKWEQLWPCVFRNQLEIINHNQKQLDFIQGLCEDQQYNIHLFSKQMKVLMSVKGQCRQNSILHGVIKLLEQWPQTQQFNSEVQTDKKLSELQKLEQETMAKYYYLTGLYLLIKGQICSMCTMALVHSRLQRLYSTTNNLQPIKSICYQRRLNHNYHLFKVSK